jgi:hypothetical protein
MQEGGGLSLYMADLDPKKQAVYSASPSTHGRPRVNKKDLSASNDAGQPDPTHPGGAAALRPQGRMQQQTPNWRPEQQSHYSHKHQLQMKAA